MKKISDLREKSYGDLVYKIEHQIMKAMMKQDNKIEIYTYVLSDRLEKELEDNGYKVVVKGNITEIVFED